MVCQPKKWLPFTAELYLITFSKLCRRFLSSEFSLWPQHYFCEAVHCHCDNFKRVLGKFNFKDTYLKSPIFFNADMNIIR